MENAETSASPQAIFCRILRNLKSHKKDNQRPGSQLDAAATADAQFGTEKIDTLN
jgi:hypothetical protein